jgi:hypothetical protein
MKQLDHECERVKQRKVFREKEQEIKEEKPKQEE